MNNEAVLTQNWKIDTNHSLLQFRTKHLGLAWISGSFSEYEGAVTLGPEGTLENGEVKLNIFTDSIQTGNEMRDNHLKTPEFFDAFTYPDISFHSTSITPAGKDLYTLAGQLCIKDHTKEISLEASYKGQTSDMWGNNVIVFQVTGSINRLDYGVTWHHLLDNGIPVLSNEVFFDMTVELIPSED